MYYLVEFVALGFNHLPNLKHLLLTIFPMLSDGEVGDRSYFFELPESIGPLLLNLLFGISIIYHVLIGGIV